MAMADDQSSDLECREPTVEDVRDLLWRMKAVTHRAKDAGDLVFLRQWFAQRGEEPPPV